MRRSAPLFLLCSLAVLAVTACGGGEDEAATTTVPIVTAAPTTTLAVTTDPERCEDVPDPADYGDATVAIRPCALPTDLEVQTIRAGSGPAAVAGDSLVFHYTRIRSLDGSLLDSSYAAGAPQTIPVIGRGGQIPGLDEGLIGAQAGALIRLDIPAELAYGDTPPNDESKIQPGDPLTYLVDVLAIIPLTVPEDAPTTQGIAPSIGAVEVTTTDLIQGDGATVEEGKFVVMNMLLIRGDNGVVLYNSWDQRTPLVIKLDPALMAGPEPATLEGIFEGVQGARVGGQRLISMPPDKAWGPDGQPQLGLPRATDLQALVTIIAVY
jgi:FKBP-type peptidyl-prolyl cis-trans isomerase